MLAIILMILKILLYVLLAILGLILLVILIVLFVPIRYRVSGSKYKEIDALIKISYLLHFIRISADYDGKKVIVVAKVLFFTVYKTEKILKEEDESEEETGGDEQFPVEEMDVDELIELWNSEKEKEKGEDKPNENPIYNHKVIINKEEKIVEEDNAYENVQKDGQFEQNINDIKYAENTQSENINDNIQKDINDDINNKNSDINDTFKQNEQNSTKQKRTKNKHKEKSTSKKSSVKQYFNKAKQFYTFLREDENRGLFKYVFGNIWKIVKSISPRKISGDMTFGLEQPDMTGYAVGVFSLLYPYTKNKFSLTADFTKAIIEGTFKFKGRILIVEILYYLVKIIADKRVRRLIKEVKKLS